MRFMMLMIARGCETAEPGAMPSAEAVAAMMKYNEELQKAGVLLALDGLHPPSMSARVTFEGGKPRVTDGPFAEAKEVLGGYWMIQVKSREEAIEWAKRCPASDNEMIEVRQVQEIDDFPPDVKKPPPVSARCRKRSESKRATASGLTAGRLTYATLSSASAIPCPPPMHSVTIARFTPSRRIACARRVVSTAPVAPMGCPCAIAPPSTLTMSSGTPSVFATRSAPPRRLR
ncbi:MAG: PhnB protein [uncultured Caballeronia sp.]|nr:MAG: PhnB protein [uncultured Caballeronia sp.]